MIKKLSVLKKFNNFVGGLTNKEAYDLYYILSAVRGMDFADINGDNAEINWLTATDNEQLKHLTTARIRSFLNAKLLLGYCSVNRTALTTELLEERNKKLELAPSHFSGHYYEAVKSIRATEGYDLMLEEKLK